MRLKVTVRHGHVNDGVRSYVESKFAKLGRASTTRPWSRSS